MEPFLTGVIAGYGIAIPVGAIAILIVQVGIKCGFRCAFAAGAGAATADLAHAGPASTRRVYFAAVIIGLGVASNLTAVAGFVFVLGAFLASLSWPTLLAVIGGFAGNRLSSRTQTIAVVMGNLVSLALAVVIMIQ
jgi:arginine exporter protein ArgO